VRRIPASLQAPLQIGKVVPVALDIEDVLDAVGPRLRALRIERRISLSDLAAVTGISTSTLSRLETGKLRPTLEQLLPLARTYGVALDELVGAPETGDPRVHLQPITRHGSTYLPLTRRLGGLQAYKLIIPARDWPQKEQRSHEGYEWLYVLNGRALLVLGDREFVLPPGEAAEFDTRVPHWLGNAGNVPTELLVLYGQQGERAHLAVRAR
jgi:transcriptional regulator with XRE-family HTH domain